MPQLRLIYDCDHTIVRRDYHIETVEMTKGPDSLDRISVPNVVSVSEILNQDKTVSISPEIYNYYDNNIVWTQSNLPGAQGIYRTPSPGENFYVTIKYFTINFDRYTENECPRCNGTNIYFSPLPLGYDMDTVSGPFMVAQEFIKFLFTVPDSDRLDHSYGSGLISDTGILHFDADLASNVRTAIGRAEYRCKETSGNDLNRTPDEVLDKVIINSIELDTENTGIYVYLTLLTVGGSQARLNFRV